MVNIRLKSSDRMPLIDLWRLVFKFTFDKKSCGYTTKSIIEENIIKWNNLVLHQKKILTARLGPGFDGYAPVGKKGSLLDEIEFQVGNISLWVVREEKGELQNMVDTYARNKIDYRLAEPMCKVFPECAKLRDFDKGREALKLAMKANPEDYKRNANHSEIKEK